MSNEELADLLKYSNPKHLYIIDYNNVLVLIICPFNAQVLQDIGKLRAKEIVEVEMVKITLDLITVFIIEGKAYYYYHFEILINV
ncbi:MAG: hypothetical protein CMC13_11305 [Flavobacteriaceae bacterium]|nr:hypothetical protein [Flavobacteriaceae bacterium]|tara:strand:- start:9829 stop:10083 length:255 start_codon:yes stop_codon:yes gene_type:complete